MDKEEIDMGEIGDDPRRIEVIPAHEPVRRTAPAPSRPAPAPTPAPAPVPVPERQPEHIPA